jgi:hypothetical protein
MSVVTGYKYLFGIHMGIGRGPVDELIEIKVGEKSAWRGSSTGNEQIAIDQPELFGGEKGEGGIVGTLTTLFGGPDQVAHPDMAAVLATPMPGFRRRITVFFDGIVSMMNPYPKPWKFRVRRAVAGWDGDPWFPATAVISLVRPVSAGESEGTTETRNVTTSFSMIAVPVDGIEDPAQYTVTIDPPGPLISIDQVYVKIGVPGPGAGIGDGADGSEGGDGDGAGDGGVGG